MVGGGWGILGRGGTRRHNIPQPKQQGISYNTSIVSASNWIKKIEKLSYNMIIIRMSYVRDIDLITPDQPLFFDVINQHKTKGYSKNNQSLSFASAFVMRISPTKYSFPTITQNYHNYLPWPSSQVIYIYIRTHDQTHQ